MKRFRIGVCYDFRNPPDSGVSDRELYAEILAQVQLLDEPGAPVQRSCAAREARPR